MFKNKSSKVCAMDEHKMKLAVYAVGISAFILDGPLRDVSPKQTTFLYDMLDAILKLPSTDVCETVVPASKSERMQDYALNVANSQGAQRKYQS